MEALRGGTQGSGHGVQIVLGGQPMRIAQQPDGKRRVVGQAEWLKLERLRTTDAAYDAAVQASIHCTGGPISISYQMVAYRKGLNFTPIISIRFTFLTEFD